MSTRSCSNCARRRAAQSRTSTVKRLPTPLAGYRVHVEHIDSRMGRRLAVLSLILLAVAALGVLLVLVGGGRVHDALLAVVLTVAAFAGLGGWANEHASMRRRAALDEKRRGDMAARGKEHERAAGKANSELSALRRQIDDERARLTGERELRLRTERARRAEREWARELRQQVLTMYKSRGAGGDLRELVLEVAIQLAGAERGLLLSQQDGDGDGKLDLVCHRGFERDPATSSLAQRFADRVMERDEIIREDTPGDGNAPADDEIDNLVAIPVYMHDDFEGVIVCANRAGGFEELDDDVLLALGDHAGAVIESHELHGQLRSSYLAIVRMLADAIEAKDPFVRARSDEVSACIEAVGRQLDLDDGTSEKLVFAGILRDVGKLGISDNVLLKAGPLDADERQIVELHPLIGSRIIERVPGLDGIAPAIRHHHERWDGGGYPGGLRGEEIPLEARVIAVADTYSAMTSTRPYRRSVSPELACAEIERCAGTQFDPEIALLFAREMRKLDPDDADNGTLPESVGLPAVQARRESGEARLGHGSISSTDHVTRLFSHRYLHEAADTEARRAQRRQIPFAVVMAELTTLPQINRSEGYAAGDHALRELGRAVERALGGMTATAGRFSGRRLAVVLPGAGHQAAAALATRVAEGFDGAHASVRTAVAVWQNGDHGDDVLARARLTLDAPPAVSQ